MAAPTRSRRSPADATGAKRDQLAKEHAEEVARRAGELTMNQQAVAMSEEVEDATTAFGESDPGAVLTMSEDFADDEQPQEWKTIGDAPVVDQADGQQAVVIRVNTTLEDVTIGAGTNFTFNEGQRYRVPIHVANHLEEKGYVYH